MYRSINKLEVNRRALPCIGLVTAAAHIFTYVYMMAVDALMALDCLNGQGDMAIS